MQISETVVCHCPLGGTCATRTESMREYARWCRGMTDVERVILCTTVGREIDWCPGACGLEKRKLANIKICEKNGWDPEKRLTIFGVPKGRQR